MPLTPEDVRNKQFTTVRLREGYDEDEVDAFLDEVETELRRLIRENDELRAKLAAATRAASTAPAASTTAPQPVVVKEPAPEPPKPAPAPPVPAPVVVEQPISSSDGAARVLALAQQTADQAIAEARTEANKIVGDARQRAEAIEREARSKADALERDAQDKHRSIIGVLETQRTALETQLDQLRQFEREYRSRLKSFLEGQLRQLENSAEGENLSNGPRSTAARPAATTPRQPMRGFLIDEDES
ncbi:DivIVA domain-containing protein [Sporichthya sp.]|uniref:DivIVA domain-containing protein n=1 Tax=Sporichthya sp. TaxID=65475 RepID=UPI0017CD27F4|nr:DivIVA domain-containing protein [Sporichthya sp.]MBA3744420.1 DivIVA domain-containing protein [Sporichthya sp.]